MGLNGAQKFVALVLEDDFQHENGIDEYHKAIASWYIAVAPRMRYQIYLLNNTGGLIGNRGGFAHVRASSLPVEFAWLLSVHETAGEVELNYPRLQERHFSDLEFPVPPFSSIELGNFTAEIGELFQNENIDMLPDVRKFRARLDEWLGICFEYARSGSASLEEDYTPLPAKREMLTKVHEYWTTQQSTWKAVVLKRRDEVNVRREKGYKSSARSR